MSTQSFKVVIECPLIVMFLFQLYPRYVPHNIPLLLPLMVHCISIPGPSQNQLSPDLKQPYADLKGAQIKVLLPPSPLHKREHFSQLNCPGR